MPRVRQNKPQKVIDPFIENIYKETMNLIEAKKKDPNFNIEDTVLMDLNPEKHLALFRGKYTHWMIAKHWWYNFYFDKSHKIDHPFWEPLKPQGELLYHYFLVCERLVNLRWGSHLAIPMPIPDSPFKMMSVIYENLKMIALTDTVYRQYKINDNQIKDANIQIERERLAALKNYEVPHGEVPKMLGIKIFYMASMYMAQQSKRFHDDYWQPFLSKYQAWIEAMESPAWSRVIFDNDKEWQQTGRGKGKIQLFDLPDFGALKPLNDITRSPQGFQDLTGKRSQPQKSCDATGIDAIAPNIYPNPKPRKRKNANKSTSTKKGKKP